MIMLPFVLEEYAEAVKKERFMRDMIYNLVANMKMVVALAAAAQRAVQRERTAVYKDERD